MWTSLESFALSGLSLISLVVFARYLSAEQFGVAAVALAIVQALTLPVEMLFHDALIQRKEVEPSHENSAFTVSVIMGCTLSGACWAFGGLFERVMHEPELGSVLQWMSLSMIGSGFGSVLTAMQRRKLEFRALALRSLGGRAGSALIAITLVVQGAGVWALVVQQVLLVCLGTLTLWLLSEQRPRFGFSWPATRELLRFGWLSTTHQLMNIVVPRMFMVLVGAFLGSKVAGVLSLAFRGLDMLRDLLAVALAQVAMPLYSRLQDDRSALFDAYTRSVRMTTLVTYPIFVGLALCAEEVLIVVFGAQWVSAAPYFVVISLLVLPHFFRLYSNALLRATGQPAAPIAEFVGQAVCVLIGMLLVGRYSAWLAMLVWAGRLLVSIPIDFWMLRRVSGMSYAQQMHGPLAPSLAAAGMACVVSLAKLGFLDALPPALRLVPIGVIGAASYAALLVVLDRELVRQFVSFIGQSIQSRRRA